MPCVYQSKSYRESNEGRSVFTWLGRGLAFGRSGCCWEGSQTRIPVRAENRRGCIEGSWRSGLADCCVYLAFARGLQGDLAWDAVDLVTLVADAGHWASSDVVGLGTLV